MLCTTEAVQSDQNKIESTAKVCSCSRGEPRYLHHVLYRRGLMPTRPTDVLQCRRCSCSSSRSVCATRASRMNTNNPTQTCGVSPFDPSVVQEHQHDMDHLVSKVATAAMKTGLHEHFGRGRAGVRFRVGFETMWRCLMQAMYDSGVELDNLLLDALQHITTALSTCAVVDIHGICVETTCYDTMIAQAHAPTTALCGHAHRCTARPWLVPDADHRARQPRGRTAPSTNRAAPPGSRLPRGGGTL